MTASHPSNREVMAAVLRVIANQADTNLIAATTAEVVRELKKVTEEWRLVVTSQLALTAETLVSIKLDTTDMKPKVKVLSEERLIALGAASEKEKNNKRSMAVLAFLGSIFGSLVTLGAKFTLDHWNVR